MFVRTLSPRGIDLQVGLSAQFTECSVGRPNARPPSREKTAGCADVALLLGLPQAGPTQTEPVGLRSVTTLPQPMVTLRAGVACNQVKA